MNEKMIYIVMISIIYLNSIFSFMKHDPSYHQFLQKLPKLVKGEGEIILNYFCYQFTK